MELHQVPRRQGRQGHQALQPHDEAGEAHRRHRQGARVLTTFTAGTTDGAVVAAPRLDIWKLLVDPDALAAMTPFLRRVVVVDDDHWRWEMTGLNVLGHQVAPCFTEKMIFAEGERFDFHHDPPAGKKERGAVEGWYQLTDDPSGGTKLETSLEISIDLPLPRAAGPAVRATMKGVIGQMGNRFSANLLRRLGIG